MKKRKIDWLEAICTCGIMPLIQFLIEGNVGDEVDEPPRAGKGER
jgi:hypothetical protein